MRKSKTTQTENTCKVKALLLGSSLLAHMTVVIMMKQVNLDPAMVMVFSTAPSTVVEIVLPTQEFEQQDLMDHCTFLSVLLTQFVS